MMPVVCQRTIVLFVCMCSLVAGGTVWAQGTPASIPDSFKGAYRLVMTNAIPSSPIGNGSHIDFTIGNSNTLCTTGLALGNPQVRELSTYWDSEMLGISLRLIVNADGGAATFAGFDLLSYSGALYGRLQAEGTGVGINPCGAAPPTALRANELFQSLESAHSDLFPANPFSLNRSGEGYDVYRFYQSTGVYLAILGDLVYARGGNFSDKAILVGTVEDLIDNADHLERPYFTEYVGNLVDPDGPGVESDDLEFIQGTYRLTVSDVPEFSPLASGTELIFVITPSGQMCVGETVLGFPRISYELDSNDEPTYVARWRNRSADLAYDMYLNRNDTRDDFRENFNAGFVVFRNGALLPYGTIEGPRISLASECIDASGGNPDLPEINAMFALAEAQYPDLFPSGPQTYNQYNDGFVYRFYYNTGITIGVKAGQVFATGGQFGNSSGPTTIGALAVVLNQLRNPPASAATRAYDLQVTGTKETKILSFPTIVSDFKSRMYGIERPDSADKGALDALVMEILDDEVRQVNSISINVLADTVTNLSFQALVTNDTNVAGKTTTRRYNLVFSIERRQ